MTDYRSEIFAYANDVVERDAQLDPIFATASGIVDYDELLPDFSPTGTAERLAAVREQRDHVTTLDAGDEIDRIALSVMRERLETRLALMESGESERLFGVLTSPLSEIRQVFELMGHESEEERDIIAARLEKVRSALESWRPTLEELARQRSIAVTAPRPRSGGPSRYLRHRCLRPFRREYRPGALGRRPAEPCGEGR